MRLRVVLGGRDAHQARDFEAVNLPAFPQEGIRRARINPGLLRLEPGVDLDEELQWLGLTAHFLADGLGDLGPVDGMDGVEQLHGLCRLVGLERSDQVQFHVRPGHLEGRPLGLRLLHAVFAEDALTGLDDGDDLGPVEGLGHGDQGDAFGRPARRLGGRHHPVQHLFQTLVDHAGNSCQDAALGQACRAFQGLVPASAKFRPFRQDDCL